MSDAISNISEEAHNVKIEIIIWSKMLIPFIVNSHLQRHGAETKKQKQICINSYSYLVSVTKKGMIKKIHLVDYY